MAFKIDYLCEFDMDCVTHSSVNAVKVRKLTIEEKKTAGLGMCTHPDCRKTSEYEVIRI